MSQAGGQGFNIFLNIKGKKIDNLENNTNLCFKKSLMTSRKQFLLAVAVL